MKYSTYFAIVGLIGFLGFLISNILSPGLDAKEQESQEGVITKKDSKPDMEYHIRDYFYVNANACIMACGLHSEEGTEYTVSLPIQVDEKGYVICSKEKPIKKKVRKEWVNLCGKDSISDEWKTIQVDEEGYIIPSTKKSNLKSTIREKK